GLFGIFNRGVFPDFAYWTKSSEVLIMTLLGGMGTFWGPSVGALALILLNQQIVSYTEYWPFVLGIILVVLLFGFPGGLAGAVELLRRRLWRPQRASGGRPHPGVRRLRRRLARLVRSSQGRRQRDHRPQRRGEDHAVQPDYRPPARGRGARRAQRARRHGGAAARVVSHRGRPVVPAHQHLREADRVRERPGGVRVASRARLERLHPGPP